MSLSVHERIRQLLKERGVTYREVHHAPTKTSEESAQARGESISIGGKALVLRLEDDFSLFVLSAARRLDSPVVRQRFAIRHCRFATAQELLTLTGLVPGSVPPFGHPILDMPLYVDESIVANERIAFNAGSLSHSIIMSTADYFSIVRAEVFCFSC